MGLINLLSVGRSLIGVSHGSGHYKLAQGNLLPNFGGVRPTGGAANGAVGKVVNPSVMESKSAAPVRGTGQGELKLEVPPAVKLAVTEPARAAPAATATAAATAVNAGAASPAKVAAAETKPAPASAATTPAAPTPSRPRAEEKFTLGRWVSLMLNR